MHAVALVVLTGLVTHAAQAARCGPTRVPKGEVCCNDSCGMTVKPAPNTACIALHCGWERHQAGGATGVQPAGWLSPFSAPELDASVLVGPTDEPLLASLALRVPLSPSFALSGAIGRRGMLPGRRQQHIFTEVIWNVPTDKSYVQAGLHLGGGAAHDAAVTAAATPYEAFAGQQLGGPWFPRAHVGLSALVGMRGLSLAGSGQLTTQLQQGQPDFGFHAGMGLGTELYWMNVAAQIGVEAERQPTDDRVYLGIPAGIYYTGIGRRVLLGVEARAGSNPGPEPGLGVQAGIRLRVHGTGGDMQDLRDAVRPNPRR